MPKGVPLGEDEIEDMRGLAEENPDWSYEQIAEELIRLGYPRRHKSVIHRYVRDIRERQAREGIEQRKAEIGAKAVTREIEGLVKRFPELEPQAKKLAEIKLQAEIEKAEREHWEASGEKKQMEQQIEDLSQRLRVAQATIRTLKAQVRELEPYPQRYKGEIAKTEFIHGLLNTCASEFYRARGEERKAERILRRDEYEGLAPDDFKPFFAGIGRRAGETDFYLAMLLCFIAGKSVELLKKEDGTRVFKFGVPTFESETFNWSIYRKATITLNPNGKVLIEKGNIVSVEGSFQITKWKKKEVERLAHNPYELLAEKEQLIKRLGTQLRMKDKFLRDLWKALSELGICEGDVLDVEETASRIGELKTNYENACLVINDLLWEKYKVSEEYRLGLPKVFSDKRIIGDKVLGMNFVLYPDRTLSGVEEEDAEMLRAKVETEKLKHIEAQAELKKGRTVQVTRGRA